MTYICRIEKLANGYEVELYDAKRAAKNAKSKGEYIDPMVGYAFKTTEEVCEFLEKNLEKAVPKDEYGSAFDALVAEEEEND